MWECLDAIGCYHSFYILILDSTVHGPLFYYRCFHNQELRSFVISLLMLTMSLRFTFWLQNHGETNYYNRLKLNVVHLHPEVKCAYTCATCPWAIANIFDDQERSIFVVSALMVTICWGYGISIMIS